MWRRALPLALALGALVAWHASRSCGLYRMRGKSAPAFSLSDLAGGTLSFGGHSHGRAVLLEFWASWCGPCRAELPIVDRVARELGPRGLDVYAVNLAESRAVVRRFVADHPLAIPVLLDDGTVAARYRVQVLPSLVLIDRDGNVVQTVAGPIDESDLRELIEPFLVSEAR